MELEREDWPLTVEVVVAPFADLATFSLFLGCAAEDDDDDGWRWTWRWCFCCFLVVVPVGCSGGIIVAQSGGLCWAWKPSALRKPPAPPFDAATVIIKHCLLIIVHHTTGEVVVCDYLVFALRAYLFTFYSSKFSTRRNPFSTERSSSSSHNTNNNYH